MCSAATRSKPCSTGFITPSCAVTASVMRVRAIGAMAFTQTPSEASSIAEAIVNAATPAFDAQYDGLPGAGLVPAGDDVLMIARPAAGPRARQKRDAAAESV